MSKDNTVCPACGSKDTHRHETISTAYATLGSAFTYADVYYLCNSCKEEIDIFNETDQNFQAGEKEAQKQFVQQAIEYMSNNGVGMALFERVFELPTRTLARWKEGNFSSSALSLLHVVITFPWIIKVAEKKFSPEYANHELISAAASKFVEQAHNSISHSNFSIEVKSETTFLAKVSAYNESDTKISPRVTYNETARIVG